MMINIIIYILMLIHAIYKYVAIKMMIAIIRGRKL